MKSPFMQINYSTLKTQNSCLKLASSSPTRSQQRNEDLGKNLSEDYKIGEQAPQGG